MKKIFALTMAVVFAVGLLAGCSGSSGGVKNNGLVSTDMVDSSSTQQRWLALPPNSEHESHLVINPAEKSGSTSGNLNRLGLNVGYLNDDLSVAYTLNDAIFLVESNSANGIGGTDVYVPDYDLESEGLNMRYSEKKLSVYNEDGKITATVLGDTEDTTTTQTISTKEKMSVDLSLDLMACINVIACDNQWKLAGTSSKPSTTVLAQNDTDATGKMVYNLTEIMESQIEDDADTSEMKLTMILTIYGTTHSLIFSDYKYVAIEKGFKYAKEDAKTTWTPYAITSSVTYPNGSAAEVMDYFAGYHTVERKITFTAAGTFFIAGYVDGTLTYNDKKNVLIVEGSNYNYVISPKRKQYVMFYESESDMLNRVNGTSEPTATTKYWTVGCGRYEVGDELYVAISLDKKGGVSVDDLVQEVKDATSAGNTAGRIDKNISFWNEYLAAITIPSDYITYSAEDFASSAE